MTPPRRARTRIVPPLSSFLVAMSLAGAARADGGLAAAPVTAAVAIEQSGSSIAPSPAVDPASSVPPPQHPVAAPRPGDQRILMLMLMSQTSFGSFGHLGQ